MSKEVQADGQIALGRQFAGRRYDLQFHADGRVELGFQQLSEMLGAPGIRVIGGMPPGPEIVTTFSGGICAASARADTVRALLDWMQSPATADTKRRYGMEPA